MTNDPDKIPFTRTPGGISLRGVVKAADVQRVRAKTPDDYEREHEIALIRLLAPRHAGLIVKLAEAYTK